MPYTTKKPCKKDLRILDLLQSHDVLSSLEIQKLAETIDHRDAIFRLKKAGHPIMSQRVNNPTAENPLGWYKKYWLKVA